MSVRPSRITLTPAASDPDGIATTQTLTAASPALILDGALATGYDVDAVAVAQTTGGAAALDINGAVGATVSNYRGTSERIIFTTASGNTGITFDIVGIAKPENNRPPDILTESVTGPAAGQKVFSANAYWQITSITTSGAVSGNVEVGLNGVATFATPQHVSFTTASDESAATWTVTGTDRHGQLLTQSAAGPNISTVVGTKNFATVTHIENSDPATGVTAGVDGTCESGWIDIDRYSDYNVGIGVEIQDGGSLTYTVEHTFDDIYASNFTEDGAFTFDHASLAAQTSSADGNYTQPPTASRLALSAYTSGSAKMTIIQSN